jgi:hypothetical protein
VRNIRLLRFNEEPDVFQSGVMLDECQPQDVGHAATDAAFDHTLIPFVLNQALALAVPCLAKSRFEHKSSSNEGKQDIHTTAI